VFEFTFNWFFFPIFLIDKIELLVDFSVLGVDNDVLVLSIKTTCDVQNFTFLIDNEFSVYTEHLPPSRVDA
jgi:hypothetical protein